MNKYIVGIDPDSAKHGVAVYENGKLIDLKNLTLLGLYHFLTELCCSGSVIVSIEDNVAVSAIYAGRFSNKDSQAVKSKKAQHVGMCKQAQIEVERACEELEIQVIHQKPSKQWKDASNRQFELVTKWNKRSNEDTRSAAYMGWLATQKTDKSRLINSVMR